MKAKRLAFAQQWQNTDWSHVVFVDEKSFCLDVVLNAHNDIVYPKFEGRIQIDMLTEVKRSFKLTRYALGYVAEYFLGMNKVDISYKSLFRIKNLVDSVDWETMTIIPRYQTKFIDNLKLHNVRKLNLYLNGEDVSSLIA